MAEVRPMSLADAKALEGMLKSEDAEYLHHFTAFSGEGELSGQSSAAVKDGFFCLTENGEVAGFFCLRGLDAGYARPSFGVYVSSRFQGRGLGRLALEHSFKWCHDRGIRKVMLKVAEENVRARSLYESAGFESLGYCPDTGHMMMEKVLM
jgi:ribosomal protein S18 acetylase RimI-like enzyme